MDLDISQFAPDSEFTLLTEQQVKRALADSELNRIAAETHRLTGSYAQAWMANMQDAGPVEDIDTKVYVDAPLAPIEQIALELMAQMAVDAIGEPLTVVVRPTAPHPAD